MMRATALSLGMLATLAGVQGIAQEVKVLAEARGVRLEGRDTTLVISDPAANRTLKRIPAASADGALTSRVSMIRFAAERQSFVVSFDSLPEIWEISVDPKAPDIYQGLVHDFRMGEGVPERGYLGVRRTKLEVAVPVFATDATGAYVTGCRADSAAGRCALALVHLDVKRQIAQFPLAGIPDFARARDAMRDRRPWLELADHSGAIRWRIDLLRDTLEGVEP